MREKATLAFALMAPIVVAAASCGDDVYTAPSSDAGVAAGNEGEPCFPDGTCKAPYKCISALCYVVNTSDADIPDGANSAACPETVVPSQLPPYHSSDALVRLGACTTADVAALVTVMSDPNGDLADWYDEASFACQRCVFSGVDDATWELVVVSPDIDEALATGFTDTFLNAAPCYLRGPGGSLACAQAAQLYDACEAQSCPSPDCDSVTTCEDEARAGPCANESATWASQCGAAFDSLRAYCDGPDGQGTLVDLVNEMCGAGGDAGSSDDAGAPDADTPD